MSNACPDLPATGGSTWVAMVAVLMIAAGIGAAFAARRPRHLGAAVVVVAAAALLAWSPKPAAAAGGCIGTPTTRPPAVTTTTTAASNAPTTSTPTTSPGDSSTTMSTSSTTSTTTTTTTSTTSTTTTTTLAPLPPDAIPDSFQISFAQNSGPPEEHQFQLLPNDDRGHPLALVISFGGDTLGGSVISYPAGGGQVAAGSATVSVTSDGLLTVTSPPSDTSIVFSYRLANDNGSDDATVTVVRTRPGGGGV